MKVKIVSKRDYPELEEIEKRLDVIELRLPIESEDIREMREYVKDRDPDIVITVGGDATFLRRADRESDIPILAIHGGEKDSLGWHADFSLRDIDQALYDLEHGLYELVKYKRLELGFRGNSYDALNDVYVNRISSSIHFKVYCIMDGERELVYPEVLVGDGVNIANAYGSTAYNLTAGGPILYNTEAIVETPLYVNKYQYSVIAEKGFYVELVKNVGLLQYDGIEIGRIIPGEGFTVGHSDKYIEKVRINSLSESLASKLYRRDKLGRPEELIEEFN